MKIGGAVLLVGVIILSLYLIRPTVKSLPAETSSSFNTDFAYDNRTFLPAIALNPPSSKGKSVLAAVVPHHLLASSLIAKGINLFVPSPPQTLIILSPNHVNSGQCDIITSPNSWYTPFGKVNVDSELLSGFLNSRTVCIDDEVIRREHGIAGLLPFIKYYLPETEIIPFAFKRNPDPQVFESFIRYLSTIKDKVGLVASLDFSHGLSRTESQKKDVITQRLITDFNFEGLSPLTSEHTDSPPALISFLKFLDSRGSSLRFIDHTDSSFFNGSDKEVTSYFLISDLTSSKSDKTFSIIFGGDVMLARTVNTRMHKYNDFTWPFHKISSVMKSSDLAVVNLESPLGSGCPLTDTGMVFCADPQSITGLVSAGIDAVNLANNHIGNQGKTGFELTQTELKKAGIGVFGLSTPLIKEVKGIKIALLGFSDINPTFPGIAQATEENITKQVTEAKKQADLVIVSFHWGSEYSRHGTRQIKLARLAIDSGGDAVIGHHPHWVQDIDTYKGKPIAYSLGNLVFDQFWSEPTRKGLLFRLTYEGSDLLKQESIPIRIYDYGQPAIE